MQVSNRNARMNTFEKLLADLVAARVEFVTVGALACAFNGWVRSTLDVDILVRRTPDNIARLLGCLARVGEGAAKELSWNDFTDEPGAVRVIEDFPIDLFVRMAGLTYEDVIADAKYCEVPAADGCVRIPYADAETMVRIKSSSQREHDKFDVLALQQIIKERK